jgi:hypothetical protein
MIFFLDFICVVCCFLSVRPNNAILILAIGAALKAITVVPFYIAAGYTPDYTDTTVNFITVMLEVGWFFYDHIISISTLHRVLVFYPHSKMTRNVFKAMTSTSISFGALFRVFRSTCRFGNCMVLTPGGCDSIIATNVLLCEFILLGALLYKCISYKKKIGDDSLFELFIKEAYLRLLISVPLGSMEALAYIFERIPGTPAALLWFLVIGIVSRQFACTILALAIMATKAVLPTQKTKPISLPFASSVLPSEANQVPIQMSTV